MKTQASCCQELRIIPIPLDDEIKSGDSVTDKILDGMKDQNLALIPGDIFVVKHKIVSKAEGQIVELAKIKPSASSRGWARHYRLDARVIELALAQSRRVVRRKQGVLITETRHGLICANSGVDVSNLDGGRHALLLPKDPDRSAARIHRDLKKRLHLSIPVIITDSFGRPWREGLNKAGIHELESFPLLDWHDVARHLSPQIRTALEHVLEIQDGSVLSREQSLALANAEGDDLVGLLVAADELRRDLVGNIVTYVVNRNINFTNICFVGCKFCAFSRGPREPDTYFLNLEQVAAKAVQAWQVGATEVCIQGGLPHGLPPFYYRDILRAVKGAVPGMHIHAFSPMEIVYGVELTGMVLEDYLRMLRDNGLDTLPGTAAEILADDVRFVLSRNKLSTEQWKEVIRTAHRCGIRSTSTLMYGHVETPSHWVNQLLLFREIQEETGGFTEFVPLGFVHQNTLLFHQGIARPGPTLAEHLKIHALSRILLAGAINNVQVSWVKLNRRLSQLCLHAGANDYGGTLMEENISREAGATAGQYTSPGEFQSLILEAGRIPAERNTTYTRINIRIPSEQFIFEQALEPEFA